MPPWTVSLAVSDVRVPRRTYIAAWMNLGFILVILLWEVIESVLRSREGSTPAESSTAGLDDGSGPSANLTAALLTAGNRTGATQYELIALSICKAPADQMARRMFFAAFGTFINVAVLLCSTWNNLFTPGLVYYGFSVYYSLVRPPPPPLPLLTFSSVSRPSCHARRR